MRGKAGMLGTNRARKWELPSVRYVRSFSVSSIPIGIQDIVLGYGGLVMYVTGSAGIYQYSLSTAGNISTASLSEQFLFVGLGSLTFSGIAFKPDGTKMYVSAFNDEEITGWVFEYSLGSPWNVSSATLENSFEPENQSSATIFPQSVTFSPDGLTMICTDSRNNVVIAYALSAAWDITTATYSASLSVSGKENQLRGAYIGDNGSQLYITGRQSDSVHQYRLSTPWSISTGVSANSVSVVSQDTSPIGVSFDSDGSTMYIAGNQNRSIYEYSLV